MSRARILVAGIGNIFLGDDAFGVEVVGRLAKRTLPDGVEVRDFGIRSFDLAYALDSADTVIIVDTASGGRAPGTLYTIEPDVDDALRGSDAPDAHSMDPAQVLRLARQLNVVPGQILVVGCEPATFGAENEGAMGLSPTVEAAVGRAVELIEVMIDDLLAGKMEPAGVERV